MKRVQCSLIISMFDCNVYTFRQYTTVSFYIFPPMVSSITLHIIPKSVKSSIRYYLIRFYHTSTNFKNLKSNFHTLL